MKRWQWITLSLLTIVSLVVEFGIEHGDHWWSSIPAFYILFGFAGCTAIIFFSKTLGKLFLQREEDYYDVE